MPSLQILCLLLSSLATSTALTPSAGSEFVAAVYEHAFIRTKNRTNVLSQQEAVAIVMENMDVYENQMKKAKHQWLRGLHKFVTNHKGISCNITAIQEYKIMVAPRMCSLADRDVFYELVREWEDSHLAAGWNMEEHMGDRIRALVNQKPELANYSHFVRLFKSQLLQMCEAERSGRDFCSSSELGSLQKSNPEKFQRLQERFITPLSSGGPCPAPSFSNVQEFFKGFIQSAASHSFNQHLMDLLIVKITEFNDKEFPLSGIEEGNDKELSIQSQPYQGTETSSQVIVTDTLKLRNRIPIYFDILRYLKKAWYSGRLVFTVPWAVEYLSMMDPLAPLLDYFSAVLNFLYRIYRESASLFSKKVLNHSKLLLTSCLGWFFEIPVIPATFFFKSLTDVNNCVEDDLKRNYSDVKPSLDSSGIVDQAILYACCPYLSVIRTVLVEAAAGMSGRSGPVKKITPVSVSEPTSRSSAHKQLQLQLEENFFRIQPDFLKRLSDFTVERLCSNIISHIKPSLLNEGVQRIQAFLDSEFSGNTNTDQAKEKCRPHVLKIIHSVTDDGVKAALESVESSKEKSLKAFQSLCPQEMNPKVVTTAASITARLVKEKTMDLINTSFPNIMEEELFAQFNKIANSILNLKTKEQKGNVEPDLSSKDVTKISEERSERRVKCCKPVGVSGETINPAMKIKALQAVLSEQSKLLAMHSSQEITSEVADAVRAIQDAFMDEGQMALIGQITVELVFTLAGRSANGVNFCGVFDNLCILWTKLKERHVVVPFAELLSIPHVNLIMSLENKSVAWESLQDLFLSLMDKQLVRGYEVEQWYVGALGSVTDEETSVEIGKASCCLMLAYHERRLKDSQNENHRMVHQCQFSLLLSVLNQKFSDNAAVSNLLKDCFKNNSGIILMLQ